MSEQVIEQTKRLLEPILPASLGLPDWTVRWTVEGYCWHGRKVIDCVDGDDALMLHEIAHARVGPQYDFKDKHNGVWADEFTKLVRVRMDAMRANMVALSKMVERLERQVRTGEAGDCPFCGASAEDIQTARYFAGDKPA